MGSVEYVEYQYKCIKLMARVHDIQYSSEQLLDSWQLVDMHVATSRACIELR